MGSNVFPGLSVDLDLPIDAAFAWNDKRIVYIIQGMIKFLKLIKNLRYF